MSQRTESKTVADNPRERRYEIHLNGELAGYCAYQRRPGTIVFTHTEVEPRFRGRGVGSRLIAAASGCRTPGPEARTAMRVCPGVH